MKKNPIRIARPPSKMDRHLFTKIEIMLTMDLAHPPLEAGARKVLATLRRRGYLFEDHDK